MPSPPRLAAESDPSASDQLPVDRCRHFRIEIDPDDGASRVPVRYWVVKRPPTLKYPCRSMSKPSVDLFHWHSMLFDAGLKVGERQVGYGAD